MKKHLVTIFFTVFIFLTSLKGYCVEKTNILYTIDNNYSIFTLISINSIIKNNTSDSKYIFHIIESDLTEKNQKLIKNFIEKRNQEVRFYNIDSRIINNTQVYNTPSLSYITSIALARLFASDILPKDIDKILYLDADTLVISDISPLYNIELENNFAGLVHDLMPSNYYSIYHFKNGYYNSGVILIDLKKWRDNNLSKVFEEYYTKNIDKFTYKSPKEEYFFLVDQDLINIVLDGKILPIHAQWNQQFNNNYKTGIIHYIGGDNKPWKINRSNKLKKIYLKEWGQIPELKHYKILYFYKSLIEIYVNNINSKIKLHKVYIENIKKAFEKIIIKGL